MLPEKWNLLGDSGDPAGGSRAARRPDDLRRALLGARAGIHLLAGSIAERGEGHEKPFNTSTLIGPDGELEARYRKIHMFDVDVGGVAYRESETRSRATRSSRAALGGALEGVTLGMTRLLRPALPGALPDPRRARRHA